MTPKRLVVRVDGEKVRLMSYKLVAGGREALHGVANCPRKDLKVFLRTESVQERLGLREADKRIAARKAANLSQ